MISDRFEFSNWIAGLICITTAIISPVLGADAIPGTITHKVSIKLAGPKSDIKGLDSWRGNTDIDTYDLLQPQEMTVCLPDGFTVKIAARSSTIQINRGKVSHIYIRRPMIPVRFTEAKADLLHFLADMHVDPGQHAKDIMATWPDDAGAGPGGGIGFAGFKTVIKNNFHGALLDVIVNSDPTGGWYYLFIFNITSNNSIPGLWPSERATGESQSETRDVTMEIPGKTQNVQGVNVEVATHGMDEFEIANTHHLNLKCPDHSSLSIIARSTDLFCFDRKIQGVFVRRPTSFVSFKMAKADFVKTLADIQVKSDPTMNRMMSHWPDEAPGYEQTKVAPQSYQTAVAHPVHGLDFAARLCPDPTGGWYYYLIFSAPTAKLTPTTHLLPATANGQ